jgi:hypothetical protein
MKQGSGEWLQQRVGRITASRVVDVMNFRKDGKPGADRLRYLSEVLCERLTGIPTEHPVNDYMRHGTDIEPLARASYEVSTGNEVTEIGIAIHPKMEYFSCSPDGLINNDGLLEIKGPATITHVGWLLADQVPEEHKPQLYAGMACCERAWGEFVSFDDRLPQPLRRFIKRLPRDDAKITEIEFAVGLFHEEIEDMIFSLRKLFGDFTLPAQMAEKTRRSKFEEQLAGALTSEDIAWAIARDKGEA